MLEEGHREGTIQRSELDLIRNVFAMEDTPVREIMTPLAQVSVLHEEMTVTQAIDQIRLSKISRVPVMSRNRKKCLGIVYMKDLLRARLNPALGETSIAPLMHKPVVIPHHLQTNRLFRRLRQSKTHIAAVENPNGDVIGIITLDQILDELLEELLQEKAR
jgi:CBS domain containing-hemolysin-like protein